MYSFAIVIWECLTREDPFAGLPPFHVVFAVGTKGARPDVMFAESSLSRLMVRCWAETPEARPSFIEVVDELAQMLAPAPAEQLVEPPKTPVKGPKDKGEGTPLLGPIN